MQRNGNYGYGKYQLSYILSCIPFANGLLGLPRPTSNYISHLIQGNYLSYGNGTSVIADFYLDGGWLGVVVLMFIFGYFVKQFEYVLFAGNYSSLLLFCIAFYFSIHFISVPRSFLLLNLKYSVWLTLILHISQQFGGKKLKGKMS
jgi:oligosaccharide repeat unit polymerase